MKRLLVLLLVLGALVFMGILLYTNFIPIRKISIGIGALFVLILFFSHSGLELNDDDDDDDDEEDFDD